MKNTLIFILAGLPAFALAQACKQTEAAKEVVPTVSAKVEARPADEAAPAAKQPAKDPAKAPSAETQKAYEKKDTYFSLPDSAGGQVDLADYAWKPVLVMFFTETCPYCTKAAPFIEKMNKEYKAGGLNVVGVSLNGDAGYTAGFAKHYGLTFPVAYGGRQAARQYGTQGVPYIYLLKKDHTIYNVWAGYDRSFDEEIKSGIAEVLK